LLPDAPLQSLIKAKPRKAGGLMYKFLFSGNPWRQPDDIDAAFRDLGAALPKAPGTPQLVDFAFFQVSGSAPAVLTLQVTGQWHAQTKE
jgi:hypothetical protein